MRECLVMHGLGIGSMCALLLLAGCPADDGDSGTTVVDDGNVTGDAGTASGDASTADGTGDPCDCMHEEYSAACGVDGMSYDQTCSIACVPVVIACQGECPCPDATCGDMTCGGVDTVCQVFTPGAPGDPMTYDCAPPPAACFGMVPSCDCVLPGADCQCVDDAGRLTVTCPGS